MPVTEKIAVLGGGSFGTAIANMLAMNGQPVTLWMRDADNAKRCRDSRQNSKYLPGLVLDERLSISSDLNQVVDGSTVIFFSVPSRAFRELARQISPLVQANTIVISTSKGIEASSLKLMSEVLEDELTDCRVGVISGPNLAGEIAKKAITATVIASKDEGVCESIQGLLGSSFFRVYANEDRHGVELAGALKNIYAIAAGMAVAMGMGQNTISVLITRSLAEMSRYAVTLGASPMTFLGLSGVGDLFVTCTSPMSRNFQIGHAMGQGMSLKQAGDKVGQVAEGVNTVRIIKQAAEEKDIYMPLVSALYDILFNHSDVKEVLGRLMVAEQSNDVEFIVS